MIRWFVAFWLVIALIVEGAYWSREAMFLSRPPLDPTYRGMHVVDLVYHSHPRYVRAHALFIHLGVVALLPGLLLAREKTVQRDVVGNIITDRDWPRILCNYAICAKRRSWPLPRTDRNSVWLGVDLMTLEPVYLHHENVFQGLMIVGQQGIGKTSRFFKTMLRQLAHDPNTSFLSFSLKHKDGIDIARFLAESGIEVVPWSMGNLVHLAIDRHGAYGHSRLEALLQAAGWASGLGSEREPFWCDTAMTHLARIILADIAAGRDPTLGSAFAQFEEWVSGQTRDDRMYQGLLETLRAALSAMANPADRVAVLYAQQDGGLHRGVLHVRPGAEVMELTDEGPLLHRTIETMTLPSGLYMLGARARAPFHWNRLLEPCSVILPPAGASKADRFALNLIKSSLYAWMADDMASDQPRLLRANPAERHRIVLSMDEAHNFLGHHGAYSDAKALAEFRESGLVLLGATQSLSQLRPGERAKDILSVIGTYLFLRVSGAEPRQVLDLLGKIGARRLERSHGLSETDQPHGRRSRANISESVKVISEPFIPENLYRQFEPGMAIAALPGAPPRIIYCPYHDQLEGT